MASLDFVGKYKSSLDIKNRFNIPSSIRKVLVPEAEETFVFAPGLEGMNLYAYPLNEWKRLTSSLKSVNPFDTSVNEFLRTFAGDAHNATMDGQGRVMLPEYILKLGQIKKEILIIGTLTKLEIWNPQVYEQYQSERRKSLQDLAKGINFSERVM